MAGLDGMARERTEEERGTLRVVVALRPEDALGFRLAGVTVEPIPPGEEGTVLRRILGESGTGVLAVEDAVLRAAPARLLSRARARGLPVLLPFALPRRVGEAGQGREYVAALVRRAVGYGVRLGGGRGGTPRPAGSSGSRGRP